MKDQFLRLAGVKSDKEFYKLFPDEASFMAKYGKQIKKLQMGAMIQGNQSPQFNPQPISFQKLYDENDMMITGSTQDIRNQEALQLADLQAQQKMSKKGSGVTEALSQIGGMMGGDAKNGKKLAKAMGGKDIFGNIGKGVSKGVDKLGGPAAVAQSAGDIIGGIQQMRDDKQTMLGAQQMAGVSDVALEASMTRPEQVQRRYVRPEDNLNTGEEFFPIFGTGTVFGRNGTEIANTFAPNTIYTDLGYANDGGMFSNFGNQDFMRFNKAGEETGISKFAGQGGGDAISKLTAGIGNPGGRETSGGGRLGKGIGSAAGTAFFGPVGGMVGGAIGQVAGNLLDRKAEKTDLANQQTQSNIEMMALNQGAQSLQQQNRGFMRDGGMANPQIINQFGDYRMNQLLRADPTMDTLRTGGQLRQNNMAMGGDLQIHHGGYAEPISYNPFLPDGGETIMFRGQSHDESDRKGNAGIGITYGDQPVEVERGEPAVQLENGGDAGENSLTVYGNLKIPKYGAEMLGDSKAAGKKFKNYVADLSRTEKRQNSIIDKASTELEDLDDNSSFGLLSLEAIKANMLGANMKLKDIADKKIKAASLQSAINDTAEEFDLVADDLAKGKVKQAKKGASIKKAQTGATALPSVDVNDKSLVPIRRPDFSIKVPQSVINAGLRSRPVSNLQTTEAEEGEFNLIDLANQVIPYLRPTDAEALNPNQLAGEMFALATNQLEPVQAQTFQPQLSTPYDISLQDMLNRNQADYRAAQRMVGYNPAAQSMLNAQKYSANQQVLGEQFRMNQGMRDRVFAENRNLLNQSNLQNLGIYDQQYQRQQQALSNTKATTQAALNSISAKYAQNQLENRNLQTYENLYNFRFDPRFRAMNINPLAQFNFEGSGMGGMSGLDNMSPEDLKFMAAQREYQEKKLEKAKAKKSRNGSIVKAIKSM